jgi:hypothetical protein
MGRHSRKMAPEDLRDRLKFGEKLTPTQIQARIRDVNISGIQELLRRCLMDGLLVRTTVANGALTGKLVVYSRVDSPPHAVAAPYPRVLLNCAPADAQIGADLWKHARLCMAVQR